MKRKWSEIEKTLENRSVVDRLPDADSFWENFRAHAKLRFQESVDPVPRRTYAWRWGLASACAVFVVVLAGLHMLPGTADEMTGTIKSFEINAEYSAIMILDDEDSDSAILWVVNMDTGTDNGDST